MFGETSALAASLRDINWREKLVLWPMAVAVIVLGIYPAILTDLLTIPVRQLAVQMQTHHALELVGQDDAQHQHPAHHNTHTHQDQEIQQ